MKILIGIISNRKLVPFYFSKNIFELVEYSKSKGINVSVQEFRAVSVEQMRNYCCDFVIDNNFDYVYMVDDDMKYPKESIYKLLQHKLKFVVGSATQRYSPFYPTQYKSLNLDNFKEIKQKRI